MGILDVKVIKSKPNSDEAQTMMEKIVAQVTPIMKRHSWRVVMLQEFCPKNPGLLGMNVNRGLKIYVRLRYNDGNFLPLENCVDTMLHELCHNQIGAHSAAFYSLWEELRKEWENPPKYTSFEGAGFTLGSSSSDMKNKTKKQLVAFAALKRCGSRLGETNDNEKGNLSSRELTRIAAENRRRDHSACISILEGLSIGDDEDSDAKGHAEVNMWACDRCTLFNPSESSHCAACDFKPDQVIKLKKPKIVVDLACDSPIKELVQSPTVVDLSNCSQEID